MKQLEAKRSAYEIILPNGRRVATVYKDDVPGGQGPTLLTPRSVWWGTRDMVFRVDLATSKREVYLPWSGGKGLVLRLELAGDAVRVRTDAREALIRPDSPEFDGYVRLRLGDEQSVAPPGVCQKIARTVEEWLGVPYTYGGDTKEGCDCSGFVGAMLRVAGRSIPRSSGEIAQAGRPVRGEVRFGDVVCRPGHVALYLGNGWHAEAPQTGDVVKKTTVWHRVNVTVRRFLDC